MGPLTSSEGDTAFRNASRGDSTSLPNRGGDFRQPSSCDDQITDGPPQRNSSRQNFISDQDATSSSNQRNQSNSPVRTRYGRTVKLPLRFYLSFRYRSGVGVCAGFFSVALLLGSFLPSSSMAACFPFSFNTSRGASLFSTVSRWLIRQPYARPLSPHCAPANIRISATATEVILCTATADSLKSRNIFFGPDN